MCGHVGMAGVLTPQDEKAFHNMLIMDSVRGVDSTGVAVIHRGDAGHHITKGIGDPFRLMDRKSYDKAFIGFQRAIIGHNRYATQGAVNDRNAHPYEFDTLIGAHNGTLTNKWQLADARDYTVDSENLYHHMETKGFDDLMKVVLGAWALVWWDKENETINLLRNKERTLYLSHSPDGKKMYWASEAWMIEGALGRNNLEFTKPMLLAEDRLYTTKISKTGEMDKTHIRYTPSTGKSFTTTTYTPTSTSQNRGTTDYTRVQQQQSSYTAPAGKLRVVPKTTEASQNEAQKHLSRSLNAGYSHSKGVLLEVLAEDIDHKGSRYLICFDEHNPSYSIRFYCNQNIDTSKYINETITADINGLVLDDVTGSYYKVAVHSVELVGDEDGDPVGGDFTTYLGHKKQQLSYNDWIGAYGDCVWCGSAVLPTDKHILTTEGQCVCHSCSLDSEVSSFIKVSVNAI